MTQRSEKIPPPDPFQRVRSPVAPRSEQILPPDPFQRVRPLVAPRSEQIPPTHPLPPPRPLVAPRSEQVSPPDIKDMERLGHRSPETPNHLPPPSGPIKHATDKQSIDGQHES